MAAAQSVVQRWSVALVCCFISFLVWMPQRLGPLLFVSLLDHYKVSREDASLPLVLPDLMKCLISPIVGYFTERLGSRKVMVSGCFLTALGIALTYFAADIRAVTVTFGLVYGIGLSFSTSPIAQIVTQAYPNHISQANGISVAGLCASASLAPPLIRFLIGYYGVSGTFLIMGGILLHSIPAAMFLREVPASKKSHPKKNGNQKTSISETAKFEKIPISDKIVIVSAQLKEKDPKACYTIKAFSTTNGGVLNEAFNGSTEYISEKPTINYNSFNNNKGSNNNNNNNFSHSEPKFPNTAESQPRRQNSFSVFLNITFILIMITQSCHAFFTPLIFTIAIDYARDKGMGPGQEIAILMMKPITAVVGTLCMGWVTDRGFATRTNYNVACFLMVAVSCTCMVLAKTFAQYFVGILGFSFLLGTMVSAFPGIVHQLIDQESQTMAMAARYFLAAPMCMTIPHILGTFRGKHNSYDWVLHITSIMSLVCALLAYLTPYTSKVAKAKETNLIKSSDEEA